MAKRLFDILCVVPAIVLLSPMLALLALWVKLDSPGPVIFRQRRVGRYGREFQILKFRTMVVNAEQLGLKVTAANDPRVTRSGHFLRHYKLDELPQLLNILLGDMSLVGPRPEVPEYVSKYPAATRELVLSVRPGLTDWASIVYRNESQQLAGSTDRERTYLEEILPRKLAYCEFYVRRHSLTLDCVLIMRTLLCVFR